MPERRARTSFAPVVLAGLASAAVCAVASAKPWYQVDTATTATAGAGSSALARDPGADMPLALALALVVLAAWGVVLVSRTRGRRVVLILGLLAAAGVNATVWTAPATLPDQLRDRLGEPDLAAGPTGWFVAAAIAAALSIVVIAVGWRTAPSWPSMSARYDAPTDAAGSMAGGAAGEADLWRAFDSGHDPTDLDTADAPRIGDEP